MSRRSTVFVQERQNVQPFQWAESSNQCGLQEDFVDARCSGQVVERFTANFWPWESHEPLKLSLVCIIEFAWEFWLVPLRV